MKQNQLAEAMGMTEEELDTYMSQTPARGELYSMYQNVMNEGVMPLIDSKVGMIVSLMRFMLAAGGVMTPEQFNSNFQQFMDAFTEKFGSEEFEQGS